MEIKYTVSLISGRGWLGLAGSAQGLVCLVLPYRKYQEAVREIKTLFLRKQLFNIKLVRSPEFFDKVKKDLVNYFNGDKIVFNYKLDLSSYTIFQREVYAVTRTISYGKTVSYQWVAEKIGNPSSARAVGQALSQNPLPLIVPCHRVVEKKNSLGGFSSGIEWKARLLQLEKVILA